MNETKSSEKKRIVFRPVEKIKNPGLFQQIKEETASLDVNSLRSFYGPEISDEEIRNIQAMMKYSFEEFRQSEGWAGADSFPQIGQIEQPLEDRLKNLSSLGETWAVTNTAFANLVGVNTELQGHETAGIRIMDTDLIDEIKKQLTQHDICTIWDIGCGGQAADILLLGHPQLRNRNLAVTGVGAKDYGKNIRPAFPEYKDRLTYLEEPIYSGHFPEGVADVVFSGRTLPYTGVVDIKRFTQQLHEIAKKGGVVWCGSILPDLFNFEGTEFKNLFEYLDYLKNEKGMKSLKYSSQSGASVLWNTAEGFPFENFLGFKVNYDKSNHPGSIMYKLSGE